MASYTPLITTFVVALSLAFILGYIACRLNISPIVGYLLAGILIGPATPGFVADHAIASELADLGVILLMFGVGLHFSIKDLYSVKKIAIPGAVVQIFIATCCGAFFVHSVGWSWFSSFVFGLSLSVASTVVLLRALEQWNLLKTVNGKLAVGWLVVEDLIMILIVVFLPPIAALGGFHDAGGSGARSIGHDILTIVATIGKAAAFIVIMLIYGRRLIPKILHAVERTGSHELFRLAVLVIALVVAFVAAKLFGVSFALGAFFAGLILNESTLSHRAAEETLPLRDAFAVLFFVAIGMLFQPQSVIEHPTLVVMVTMIIILGKSVAALLIVLAFRYPLYTGLIIAASLAQIGEFSFILAEMAHRLGILSLEAKNLIIAGALFSIIINPLWFKLIHQEFLKRK